MSTEKLSEMRAELIEKQKEIHDNHDAESIIQELERYINATCKIRCCDRKFCGWGILYNRNAFDQVMGSLPREKRLIGYQPIEVSYSNEWTEYVIMLDDDSVALVSLGEISEPNMPKKYCFGISRFAKEADMVEIHADSICYDIEDLNDSYLAGFYTHEDYSKYYGKRLSQVLEPIDLNELIRICREKYGLEEPKTK